MFVKSFDPRYASLGVGKLGSRKEKYCAVEYFDSPAADPITVSIEIDRIEQVKLAPQTRVYHYDSATGVWEIGRLLEDHGDTQVVEFSNRKSELKSDVVFVRWAREIADPTPLLANWINESPRISDGRSAFVRSQMRQRAASRGVSALLSSAIELETHQIEVVRRILQDPVQRYLLADEVGLGKTVEAGVLIRQCILDAQQKCNILVIVPPALVSQWRTELTQKFFLEQWLDRNVHVIALDDDDRIRALLPRATMLVIDEAHHLTDWIARGVSRIYNDIAAAAPKIDRVLLLSATPALHNERGFLAMLHLIDPEAYPLGNEDAFRRKIESRQTLAEIVAGLTPENALYLDYTIDQLVTLFPDDELLQEHANELRNVLDDMPIQTDPILIGAIGRLHGHLSEVYRLHRRIVRNRRRSTGAPTPDRSGVGIVRYRNSDRAELTAAMEDWRFEESIKLDPGRPDKLWNERLRAFRLLMDRASQYSNSGTGGLRMIAQRSAIFGDPERFDKICRCLGRSGISEERTNALVEAITPFVSAKVQCVIFCSDRQTADTLARRITEKLGLVVDRHDPDDDGWTCFIRQSNHLVLVCDRRAEEGLNLQGGKKVVIHYDLPLNPNRIEQRLGRVDRYGYGEAVHSLVLACEDDPLELAWVDYLNVALRLFDRSVASLQYLIEQSVRDMERALFTEGLESLIKLTARCAGKDGLIEQEIRAIDQQDALDSLGAPPMELAEELSEVDENWEALAGDTSIWIERTLQLSRIMEPEFAPRLPQILASPFRYVYSTSSRHTLIPLTDFVGYCAHAIDSGHSPRGRRAVRTFPYTFSRQTALSPIARVNGVRLLRYGDPLIHGLTALTEADDRGRSFAMWRFEPDYVAKQVADLYFRFDFVLETDTTSAVNVLQTHERDTNVSRAAIRRRSDFALPPFHQCIWLDRELSPVKDVSLLHCLMRRFSYEPASRGAVDFHITPLRYQCLQKLQIPELDHWREFCAKARDIAEDVLRGDPETIATLEKAERHAAKVDNGHLARLRMRARLSATNGERRELDLEEQLSAALQVGIQNPRARLETIGAVFISGDRSATHDMSGWM